MTLTAEQKTEVLNRLDAGERPFKIMAAMDITHQDIKDLRAEDVTTFDAVRHSKTARLAKLNAERTRVQARLDAIDSKIAAVEAEQG